MQLQCWQKYGSVSTNIDATYIRFVQWWVGNNSVTRDDAETVCCGRECSIGTHSLLRGSVSCCSITCVLATKFGGEARMLEISKTHKSFMEIPPRDDLIRLLTYFFNVS